MLKMLLLGLTVSFLMASCSSPLQLNNQYAKYNTTSTYKKVEVESNVQEVTVLAHSMKSFAREKRVENVLKENEIPEIPYTQHAVALNTFSPSQIQIKYATLLNITPGLLTNTKLLETVDDWYGTRYRYGGTTKNGIDCSAFIREVYKEAFDIELPRTAREQYKIVNRITSSDLQQGDLLFFNTTGGISHVGMYMGNNKFVHASTTRGVIVSDLEDTYYASRYLGAGRVQSSYYAAN